MWHHVAGAMIQSGKCIGLLTAALELPLPVVEEVPILLPILLPIRLPLLHELLLGILLLGGGEAAQAVRQ